jgi:hypothetical protein
VKYIFELNLNGMIPMINYYKFPQYESHKDFFDQLIGFYCEKGLNDFALNLKWNPKTITWDLALDNGTILSKHARGINTRGINTDSLRVFHLNHYFDKIFLLGNDESHENKLDEGSDNTNTFDYTLASSKNEIFDSSSSAKKILVVDSIQTMCVIDRIFNDKIRKIPYDWYYIEFRNIEGDIEKSFAIDKNIIKDGDLTDVKMLYPKKFYIMNY